MGEISGITTGTTAGTQQAAASVGALAALADDLRESVAAFRLGAEPASQDQATNGMRELTPVGAGQDNGTYAGVAD